MDVGHTYQLHVSAGILAIFRLYSTYKAPIQYMWSVWGTRSRLQWLGGVNKL